MSNKFMQVIAVFWLWGSVCVHAECDCVEPRASALMAVNVKCAKAHIHTEPLSTIWKSLLNIDKKKKKTPHQ